VIDVDTSGELGKSKYSQSLNEGIPCPVEPGKLIGEDDVVWLYHTLGIK